jgi:hypothetical protein
MFFSLFFLAFFFSGFLYVCFFASSVFLFRGSFLFVLFFLPYIIILLFTLLPLIFFNILYRSMVKKYALDLQKHEVKKDGEILPSVLVNTDSITDELFPTISSKKQLRNRRVAEEEETHVHDDGYSSEDDEFYGDSSAVSSKLDLLQQVTPSVGGGGGGHLTSQMKNLPSPMLSPLLMRARVVERKDVGTLYSGWITCLALLTFDSFLHIYDVPTTFIKEYEKQLKEDEKKRKKEAEEEDKKKKAQEAKLKKSKPDAAAHQETSSPHDDQSLPTKTAAQQQQQQQPTPDMLIASKNIAMYNALCNATRPGHHVAPRLFRSININKATASWKPNSDNSDCLTFMIEETYERKNVIFLSKESTRTITLKCESQEDMVDWCVQIKHAKK